MAKNNTLFNYKDDTNNFKEDTMKFFLDEPVKPATDSLSQNYNCLPPENSQ